MDAVTYNVKIFVSSSKQMIDFEVNNVENLWLEVKIHGKVMLVGTFYRPPSMGLDGWNYIALSIERAKNTGIENILITGDFNCNQLIQAGSKINDIAISYGFSQIIQDATHFTETSQSLIDLMLVSNTDFVMTSGVGDNILPASIRYHCPIYCVLKFPRPHKITFTRRVWLFDRADFDEYRDYLSKVNWDTILNEDVNESCKNVTALILRTAEKFIPCKTVVIRKNDSPWMHNSLRRLIRKRRRAHSRAKKTNKPAHWQQYRSIRNLCVSETRNAKLIYYEKLTSKLANANITPNVWWKTLNSIIRDNNKCSEYPPLVNNDVEVSDDFEKAELFNNYFNFISSVDDSNAQLPPEDTTAEHNLSDIFITDDDVKDVLSLLNTSKATGPDLINPRLLKEASDQLCKPLARLYNLSLRKAIFPDDWKIANVIPVFKSGDRFDFRNYRPISLLSNIGKCMEKCIFKYIHNFLVLYKIITSHQSGFRPKDSTVYQLLCLASDFYRALDMGKEIRIVFCDISKAFDKVWHKGLLFKLRKIGIDSNLLLWFENYLSNRQQQVVINGKVSTLLTVGAGVPQGSILGPLLFLIYINDLVDDIESCIKLFADDTSLYVIVDSEFEASVQLNRDLDKISEWANQWLVNFNPNKTESMIISKRLANTYHPPLFMNNVQIREVEHHKHLGVTISDNFSWNTHVEDIVLKASARLNMMRRVKYLLDRYTLERVYLSFIRPLLEYADSVWDNIPAYISDTLENIQLEAARIATGGTKLTSRILLYRETGWVSLQDRRNMHKLIQFYKMYHKLTPEYLSCLVPASVRDIHGYNTRNADYVRNVTARTAYYGNSFLPSVIKLWNEIPVEVRNASLSIFKKYLNRNKVSPPRYYYIGSRKAQILHSKLRLECSALNEHLFRKNLIDSPRCSCGSIETPYHYLLQCPKYRTARLETIQLLDNPLNTHDLLFGNDNLSNSDNETIFKKVHEYVIKTKRFC